MELNLKGQVAIVTGAAQGMGRAIAQAFAAEGVNVAVVDLNEEKAIEVCDELKASGAQAIAVKTDVSSPDAAERMAKTTLDAFGGIDILVNNAGFWVIKFFKDLTPADWEKEIAVNYYGVLNCTKAVLDHMLERGKGRIINLSSDAARVGELNHPTYCGAKAAVVAFTKALAKDVGPKGILVNTVAPGWTETEGAVKMDEVTKQKVLKAYPLRKTGKPQDVADMSVLGISQARPSASMVDIP
ncbi:SDR family NAD(P)-dependent oxidoreductase [Chloroflexota bacterium]